MERYKGMAFVVNVVKNDKHAIELEMDGNGKVKEALLDNIEQFIKKSVDFSNVLIYKRTNGIILFEKSKHWIMEHNKLDYKLNYLHTNIENIIKKYNDRFLKKYGPEMFKASYGAESSDENVVFEFEGKREIIGVAVNVAFKIAGHKDNPRAFYVGQNLSKIINVNKVKSIDAIKGMNYKAYKKINEYKTITQHEFIEKTNIVTINKNDGAAYVMVDIKNSTKALFKYDIISIAKQHIELLGEIKKRFTRIGFKNQFRGDGIIFWKHNINSMQLNGLKDAFTVANNIMNGPTFSKLRNVENLKKFKGSSMFEIETNIVNSNKIKIGMDATGEYEYINSKVTSQSPHKVLTELCEKEATKEFPIVVGESMMSKLYLNHKHYGVTIKTINKYQLWGVKNTYLSKSFKQKSKKWSSNIFNTNSSISFLPFLSNETGNKVKNFGKEALEKNETMEREGKIQEKTAFNGLHFYITSKEEYLQVFINDGKGGYVKYGL